MIRSNRPGRIKAGSSTSRRLVAAKTQTRRVESRPSIHANSWFNVCSASSLLRIPAPKRPESLDFPRASNSSMNIIHGANFSALANVFRTRAAPLPTNTSTKSDPEQYNKGTPAVAAVALANIVFPVPGGPSRSNPVGARAPRILYLSGLRNVSTSSMTSNLAVSMPSMSLNVTRGPSPLAPLAIFPGESLSPPGRLPPMTF
mmetsp:Transcript_21377/g.38637  ORF Transcript_21377/g.38637 Transcript_21377/m.38637 type:complete len:202 (+) Transcript_21377:584-1189(+)